MGSKLWNAAFGARAKSQRLARRQFGNRWVTVGLQSGDRERWHRNSWVKDLPVGYLLLRVVFLR